MAHTRNRSPTRGCNGTLVSSGCLPVLVVRLASVRQTVLLAMEDVLAHLSNNVSILPKDVADGGDRFEFPPQTLGRALQHPLEVDPNGDPPVLERIHGMRERRTPVLVVVVVVIYVVAVDIGIGIGIAIAIVIGRFKRMVHSAVK
eukprot:CAMPEP_0172390634 /NCGR_PEP_ID=MMETSP1061-20121228/7237_1 /TAXON_ID=37318 /ORGANISM="Pseudo-nitzschia pungens, Strain cf. pungens" /LENGTH=144 /DNA_ID=CAMNT_0013121061 /DNA_START=117 /DNA_END=551 /DNA_ORIENTATION=+